MKTVSIGYMRDDGDFQILAIFNNNDESLEKQRFLEIVKALHEALQENTDGLEIIILEREDAPDYVTL